MASFPHKRMLASAGTGKTYQLTSRYLQLVLDGAEPSTILATTFTRAAAAEIRDRVLVTAAGAVESEKERALLAKRTGRSTLSQTEANSLLGALLKDLGKLQVCTLHSFFAQVTSAFAPELGLPESLVMLSDEAERGFQYRALARAFDVAIMSRREEAFLGALAGLAKGAPDRSVTKTVRNVIEGGLETYYEAKCAPTPWLWASREQPTPFPVKEAAAKLRAVQAQREAESGKLDAIGKNLEKLAVALETYATRAQPEDLDSWEDLLKSGVAAKVRLGEETFSRVAIDRPTHEAIAPLIDHLHKLALADYSARTGSTYFLLHEYARAREEVRREEGVATFNDIVRVLSMEEDALLRDDIWFRLDGSIRHLLLDEFQDTSLIEWSVLRPLAAEIVSDATGERTFFCVGDVKQSIYGWRGGLPGILEDLPSMILEGGAPAALEDATLSRSHRSASEVLEAVNEVFGSIRSNRAIQAASAGAAEGFARSWEEHETALDDLRGCVELRSVEPTASTAEGRARASAIEAARLAAELHLLNPSLEIGILAPRNDVVGHVVELLRAEGIDATGEGGGSFLDCGATIVMLDALRLAEHPGDSAAAFNILNSPLGPIVGLEQRESTSAAARGIRKSIARVGLSRTIESWVQALSGQVDRREIGRLERLITEAQRLERNGESSSTLAAQALERTHLDEPGGDVIRAMTIHKSKGLAFDVVIVPGLDSALFHKHPALALDRPMPPGDIRRIIRWVREPVRPPEVEGLHEASRIEHVRERLCQLYVAMTRARRGLFLVVGPELDPESESMAGILRYALGGVGASDPDAGVLSRIGLRASLEPSGERVDALYEQDERDRSVEFEVKPERSDATRKVERPPSATHDVHSFEVRERESGDEDPRLVGIAWHRLLESISFIEEGVLSREELVAALSGTLPGKGDAWYDARVDAFLETLDSPGVMQVLSKEALGPKNVDLRVECELPLLRLTEQGGVQEGVIDRVVLFEEDGVERALIVDWKTDRVAAGAHAAHAERYREQLGHYRDGIAQLSGIQLDQIAAQLVFVRDGIAVDLF